MSRADVTGFVCLQLLLYALAVSHHPLFATRGWLQLFIVQVVRIFICKWISAIFVLCLFTVFGHTRSTKRTTSVGIPFSRLWVLSKVAHELRVFRLFWLSNYNLQSIDSTEYSSLNCLLAELGNPFRHNKTGASWAVSGSNLSNSHNLGRNAIKGQSVKILEENLIAVGVLLNVVLQDLFL